MPTRFLLGCFGSPALLALLAIAGTPRRAQAEEPPPSPYDRIEAAEVTVAEVTSASSLGDARWVKRSKAPQPWQEEPPAAVTAPPAPADFDPPSDDSDGPGSSQPPPELPGGEDWARPAGVEALAAAPLLWEPGLPPPLATVTQPPSLRPDRWFADWQQPPSTLQSQSSPLPPRDGRPEEPRVPPPLLPEELPEPLPDLEPAPTPPGEPVIPDAFAIPAEIFVERFEVVGSTIFSEAELAALTQDYEGRSLSFPELLEVRDRITQYYTERGYLTTGALIPRQPLTTGTVTIQVVEGRLEAIVVQGTRRLHPNYVRSRLAIATRPPLQIDRLRDALQLLQLDPLISTLDSELTAGTELGTNRLIVRVREAKSFSASLPINNNRSPSVGSLRRGAGLTEANLLGLGDSMSLNYGNTDGSDSLDISYLLPVNPRNGTLRLAYGTTASQVIEDPFDILDIRSTSRYYELGFRQPLWQTPAEEFALGLNFSRQESETSLLGIPFPFPFTGADDEGQVRISALRFYQEWTNRSERQVLAARSQFSLGVDWLGATVNREPPDTRFFSWRGQGQWVRLLAPDTLLVMRGDLQLGDRPLPSLERFGLGGQDTVRGYRQDTLLADNGLLASVELRWPVLRWPEARSLLQIAPFADFGYGWNNSEDNPVITNAISSIGLGLRWQLGSFLTARFDWGLPLTSLNTRARTWQENGLYFSIVVNPF